MLCDSREKLPDQIEKLKNLLRQMMGQVHCLWSDDCEFARVCKGLWLGDEEASQERKLLKFSRRHES